MSDWKDSLKKACCENTLARARSCLGKQTRYRLGKGGINPLKPLTAECDCSGFVAWAIGIPRELPPRSGKWLQTTTYWEGGGDVGSGLFDPTTHALAEAGDLYVYPDLGGKQGHIGIVSELGENGPSKVIHCSKGNDKSYGDAIRETEPTVFARHPKARLVKVDYAALRDLFDIPEPDLEDDRDDLPPGNARLHHPLLAFDTSLQLVITGRLVLEPTGDHVGGCGALHDALNRLASINPRYRVDLGENQRQRGFYGAKTAAAIKNFQRDRSLAVTGETDFATLLALDAALTALGDGISPAISISTLVGAGRRWMTALAAASTKGASAKTARQDGLSPGVEASHKMAQTDLGKVLNLLDKFCAAGEKFDVPPAMLAAIASRESRCGGALKQDGTGDNGNGWGIMQVDKRHHTPVGARDSLEHIEQATEILARYRRQVEERRPAWEDRYILQGAAVAYNSGMSNVQSIERMDIGTTGDDYGSDVIARAQFYSRHMPS